MDLTVLINKHYEELNENERYISKYILQNIDLVKDISIVDLAEKTLTSKSSILRFTKKLGFSGFSEFKYSLRDQTPQEMTNDDLFELLEDDFLQTFKLFKQQNLSELLKIFHECDSIYMFGTGWGQRNALNTFSRSLVPVGKFPILIESEKELELALDNITEDDLLFILSLSGESKPSDDLLNLIKLKDIPIASITSLSSNRLANLADYNLFFQSTPVTKPIDPSYSLMPMFQILDMFHRAYITQYS